MSTAHPEQHEELIQRVLVGELDEDDPEVRRRLESCPTCAADLSALREVERRVSADATEEREVFLTAESLPAAPGADRVEPLLRERAGTSAPTAGPAGSTSSSTPPDPAATNGPGSAPPSSWRRFTWLAVAAAAVLAFLLWGPDGNGDAGNAPLLLGDDELRLVGPTGDVAALDDFRWEAELPPGGWFELVVFDDTPGGGAAKVEHVRHLEESSWRADADRERSFPDAIRWELRVFDAAGSVLHSGDARARRSSR